MNPSAAKEMIGQLVFDTVLFLVVLRLVVLET